MKIILYHRSMGCHNPIKELELPCAFDEVYDGKYVNEDKLICLLPKNFLPSQIKDTLITVSKGKYSEGQIALKQFRPWAKYFDAYCLELNN